MPKKLSNHNLVLVDNEVDKRLKKLKRETGIPENLAKIFFQDSSYDEQIQEIVEVNSSNELIKYSYPICKTFTCYGDGDQTQLQGGPEQLEEYHWEELNTGDDYSPMTNENLSQWCKDCYNGNTERVEDRLETDDSIKLWLDYRESSLRFNGLFHVVAGATSLVMKDGDARVHKADESGNHVRCMKLLLSKGANPNSRDICGYSPLHHCIMHVLTPLTMQLGDILLENGADIDAVNRFGCSPIFEAIQACQLTSIDFLMERGASVHVKDNQTGYTAMQFASHNPRVLKCVVKNLEKRQQSSKPCCVCHKQCTKRCVGCFEKWYCGSKCQKAAWKDHKLECKEIRSHYKSATVEFETNIESRKTFACQRLVLSFEFINSQRIAIENEAGSIKGHLKQTSNPKLIQSLWDNMIKHGASTGGKGFVFGIFDSSGGLTINCDKILDGFN